MDILGIDALRLLAAAGLAAALWVLVRRAPRAAPGGDPGAVLLFRNGALVDSTPAGVALLPGDARDLASALRALDAAWPGLAAWAEGGGDGAELAAREGGGPPLTAESFGATVRLSVEVPRAPDRAPWSTDGRVSVASGALQRMEEELTDLRSVLSALPFPVWRPAAEDGRPAWCNDAYAALEAGGEALADALTPEDLRRLLDGAAPIDVADAGGGRWRVGAAGADVLAAVPQPDAAAGPPLLVNAFAALPTGIVAVAPDGRLAAFNPAFAALLGASPEDLSRAPRLAEVLEGLRERGLVAAPREWAERLAALGAAARGDAPPPAPSLWDFAGGDVWRVTVERPPAGGGCTLMIEDLSAHAAETRHLRAQAAAAEGVLDLAETPVAAFASGGGAVLANAAYRDLFGGDPVAAPDGGLRTGEAAWAARYGRTAATRLAEALGGGARSEVVLETGPGATTVARCAPLPGGGAAMVLAARPPRARPGPVDAANGTPEPPRIAAE